MFYSKLSNNCIFTTFIIILIEVQRDPTVLRYVVSGSAETRRIHYFLYVCLKNSHVSYKYKINL